MGIKGGIAGESLLRERAARVRQRKQNRVTRKATTGPRYNSRHKPSLERKQRKGPQIQTYLAPIS
jgi:hypothetical protein